VEQFAEEQPKSDKVQEEAQLNAGEDQEGDDDKEMTEEEAKKAALYRWAKENFEYSTDKSYVNYT
jgi:hypothetical protein